MSTNNDITYKKYLYFVVNTIMKTDVVLTQENSSAESVPVMMSSNELYWKLLW